MCGAGAGVGGEVGAEQEHVAGEKLGAKVGEDGSGGVGGEVADAGADIEGEGAGVAETVKRKAFAGVVGDLDAHGDAGDVGANAAAGLAECGGGDVYRLVDDGSLPTDGGGEEDAGLGSGAGSELDEGKDRCGIGAAGERGLRDDIVGVGGEDAALGAGEIVLGELGDLLEELGAGFIVEEPGGEGLGSRGEAVARFRCYGFEDAGSDERIGCFVERFRDRGDEWHLGSSPEWSAA